jgi:hypothetical protein
MYRGIPLLTGTTSLGGPDPSGKRFGWRNGRGRWPIECGRGGASQPGGVSCVLMVVRSEGDSIVG